MAIDEAAEAPPALDPDDPRKPESPSDLTRRSWLYVLPRTASEFIDDQGFDLAAD